MATTRRLRSSAASPDPSCRTTPSWQLPGYWAMGSGSERASSRNFNPTICSRTGSAGRARATTKARSRDWSASSGGTSWSPSRGPRASRPSTMLSRDSAAGARRRGCGVTRRPSASASHGTGKPSYQALPARCLPLQRPLLQGPRRPGAPIIATLHRNREKGATLQRR